MQILENIFNPNNVNIMLDIETTGTKPGCRVLSIGLAYFDKDGVICDKYLLPSLNSQNGVDEPSTLEWWVGQSAEARLVFSDNLIKGIDVSDVHKEMCEFFDHCKTLHSDSLINKPDTTIPLKPRIQLWGNSSTFDNVILAAMFYNRGYNPPWNTFGDRCYRTLINAIGKTEVVRSGTHHDALDDAIHQVNVLLTSIDHA